MIAIQSDVSDARTGDELLEQIRKAYGAPEAIRKRLVEMQHAGQDEKK